jgi:putative lipoprotein
MRRALAVLALAAALLSSASARADDDPWWGEDKALHFGASATIAAGGYVLGASLFEARGHALLTGAGLAALAGIGKETLDLAGYGHPSWKDLAWDGIGLAFGLALAFGVDLLVRGVSPATPLFRAPEASPRAATRAAPALEFAF